MDYDFGKFIRDSTSNCKTKSDFVKRIVSEESSVLKISDGQSSLKRQLYLKRLDNAKFCLEKGAIKENDHYNTELARLIDRLI